MIDQLNELIDHNLNIIYENPEKCCWIHELKDLNGNNLMDPERLSEIMEQKGLLDIDMERGDLSEFGYEIVKYGGWIKYLKAKQEQQEKEEAEKSSERNIERIKSQLDLRLKTWQVKTFWPIFFFALIGFGFGAYNFIKSLSNTKNTLQHEQRIEQLESELIKIRNFTLPQKSQDQLDSTNTKHNEKK